MAQISSVGSRWSLPHCFVAYPERAETILDPAAILESAVLRRYRSLRAFERATGIEHTLFITIRRGVVPNLKTLTSYCRGVGVTFASVLAACWQLDLNKLPELHLLSSPGCTTVLPITGAAPGGIFPLSSGLDAYGDQPLSTIEKTSRFKTVHLGDWSLFPLFCPGDFLLVEPTDHNPLSLENACRCPRPIVLARGPHGYALGHVERSASLSAFVLEPHPESGYPRLELKDNLWELIGTVRAYFASVRRSPIRPHPWAPKRESLDTETAAASAFGRMAREARTRRGLSGQDVADAIRQLTPHLPGKAELYLLSKARIYNIESNPHDSILNVFGLFALLAVYGLDYREALNALGFPIDDGDRVSIQERIGFPAPPRPLAIDQNPWTGAVLKHWNVLPSQLLSLFPHWSGARILYHGPRPAHPMAHEHSFLTVDETCNDLPAQPVYGDQSGLHWPLFVLETPHGPLCSNAYRAGGQVRLIPHPLMQPETGTIDLRSSVRVAGRVTGIAAVLPESFGWD
jgi:hypothetical protein